MKKKRRIIAAGVFCAVFVMLSGIIAFAGDYDTPTIPICSHSYSYTIQTPPTCTETGVKLGTCVKCSKTKTQSIPAAGHMHILGSTQTAEGVEIACRYCDYTEVKTAQELAGMWGEEYINSAPHRGVSNSYGYLDLDGNDIINAKDYAIIQRLCKNEARLIEAQNQSISGSETIEDLLNADYYSGE